MNRKMEEKKKVGMLRQLVTTNVEPCVNNNYSLSLNE
jgi:hypothetical protein